MKLARGNTSRRDWLVVLFLLFLGCNDNDGEEGPSPAVSGRPATCDGAAAEYGETFADALIKQGQPASIKDNVRAAVVTACKEDNWDAATLGCLSVASDMRARTGTDTLDACVHNLAPPIQKQMEERVKATLQ